MMAGVPKAIANCELIQRIGKVSQLYGLVVESKGPDVFLGEECEIYSKGRNLSVKAEVVALKDGKVMLMPHGEMRGVSLGNDVIATGESVSVAVGEALLGRVIDAFGHPLDNKPAPDCCIRYPLYGEPLNPLSRTRISEVLETGVKLVDSLTTIGRGQRMGIFSGSGVGKSTLIGMISRYMDADVNVIALVGERGREVLEFIESALGPEGLKRSVVVVATSDQPALKRSHAALAATSIAEYFRDQGKHVVLTMDSLTRYAMALREIGLAVGEPPTARGYTPSVFANMPKLLERCGTSSSGGSITAFYSVLVEGDDLNDPIADSSRSILDGHLVLTRELANRGRYPAIDVLASTSRLLTNIIDEHDLKLVKKTMSILATYQESKDMIDIGAYQAGNNAQLDHAIMLAPRIEEFLQQSMTESKSRTESMAELRSILDEA